MWRSGQSVLLAVALMASSLACTSKNGGGAGSATPPGVGSATPPGAGSANAQVVRSADGSVQLSIPDGALPSGTKVSDVRIARLQEVVTPVRVNGTIPVAFGFSPDGVTFSTPLTLTVGNVVSAPGRFVQAYTQQANGEPLPLDTDTTYDGRSPFATVTTHLAHFSNVYLVGDVVPVQATLQFPVALFVEQSAEATAQFTASAASIQVAFGNPPQAAQYSVTPAGMTVSGTFTPNQEVGLTPGDVVNPETPASVSTGSLTATGTFGCSRPGGGFMHYIGTLKVIYETTYKGGAKEAEDSVHLASDANCFPRSSSAPGSGASPAPADERLPVVDLLQATLTVPVTTFTIKAHTPNGDPKGGDLSYEWVMFGEACGTPPVPWLQETQSAKWSHSSAAPDNCQHTGTDHPVITIARVTNNYGTVRCFIQGTENVTLTEPGCLPGR